MVEIMMSIKPRFVEKIVTGEKTMELRSRRVNLNAGTRVWIYSTLPKGSIEVVATIGAVHYATPQEIWSLYSKDLAITLDEFKAYVNGNKLVSAIKLEDVTKIHTPLTLSSIRSIICKFHPPQFFSYIERYKGLPELLQQTLICRVKS